MEPGAWRDSTLLRQYLQYLKSKNYYPKLILLIVTLGCVIASVLLSNRVILGLSGIPLFTFSLITLWEAVTVYRLSGGDLPTAESEIRDILKFILDHPIDIEPAHPLRQGEPAETTHAPEQPSPPARDGAFPA